jgi:hypothetical protein
MTFLNTGNISQSTPGTFSVDRRCLNRADVIPGRRAGEHLVRVAVGPLVLDNFFDKWRSDRHQSPDRADTVWRRDSLPIQCAATDQPRVVRVSAVIGHGVEHCLDRRCRGPCEGELDHRPIVGAAGIRRCRRVGRRVGLARGGRGRPKSTPGLRNENSRNIQCRRRFSSQTLHSLPTVSPQVSLL